MTRTLCSFWFLLALALGVAAVAPADAQTVTTLLDFTDMNGSGCLGLVLGTDGNLYGTTGQGGSSISIDPRGIGYGTVFKMTPSGTLTTLVNFNNTNGSDPAAVLVQGSDGNFYGTTETGGSSISSDPSGLGFGTVFKITPTGTLTTLHNFTAVNGHGDNSDGADPQADLIQGTDGNFYGATSYGGSSDDGTVFKMTSSGTLTTLVNFNNTNGSDPAAGLVQGNDGNFYGTTFRGGSSISIDPRGIGYGTVFMMTPSGTLTTLVNFTGTNGGNPIAGLVQGSDGDFYGTTYDGGSSLSISNDSGSGTVFKITPTGTLTTLHNFSTVDANNENTDGSSPIASLVQGTDGDFYGTAYFGGTGANGALFKITPGGTLTPLYEFSAGDENYDGRGPGGLVFGPGGSLYGTTNIGGMGEKPGTIFRFNPSNIPVTIAGLTPASVSAGSATFSLTITGASFTNLTTVFFGGTLYGGTPLTVTSQTATHLTVTVPASVITTTGPKTVLVRDYNNGTAWTTFTVTSDWNAQDVAAVSDGTARLLWDRGDGAAGIWVLGVNNTQTLSGPTYGPYQGWTAQDITAAADGTSRILWNRYDGATGVWAMDAHGNQTSVGPTYGPFSGWKAIDLAAAPNGTSRLMWRYTNGQAGLLSLNATGGEVLSGRSYGPYTGWTATAVGAAGDGTARMLWTRSDGAMGLWSMDSGDLQLSVGPTYGPYSDSHGTWRATDLSTSADGTSQVLWKRNDGAIGVWTFSASNAMTTVGSVYGPYAGFTAAALDAANGKSRVLWVRLDRAAGVWSFGSNELESLIGPVYGPY